MLSVVESAEILQVTPTRVRALIAQGALPAQKVGHTWTLREEDVMQRAATRPSAGRIALRSLDEHLVARRSFNQETTLAGHRAFRTMAEAREKEYRVFLFYIGLANESIALQRIERHAQAGGHDIDEALVRKRYRASLANLSKALPYCEEAHVLDNTVAFKRIALWHRNTLAWWGGIEVSGSMASRSHRRRIALETIVARPTRAFDGRGRRTWVLCGRRTCSR